MKNLSTVLMALVILFGIILAATPFIGSIFFQEPENSTQQAKSDVARSALSRWFNTPMSTLVDVHAVRKTTQDKRVSRYSFSTLPDVVRGFITHKNLQQKPLTDDIMQRVFVDKTISWWQPEALQRETWFTGSDQGRALHLIYNDKTQRGVLVIE